MNISRLSTLSLSLVVAVLTLGYANPSFAAPKKCDGALPGTPGCGGGNNTTGIEYTVELMGRVFDFDSPVDVTPNEKENALFPVGDDLTFDRPGCEGEDCSDDENEAISAWDAVFASCENFFGPNTINNMGPTPIVVSGFTVPAGDWRINRDGGVRLVMPDIPFDFRGNFATTPEDTDFKVTLQLIGDDFFDNPDASWLPVPGLVPGNVAMIPYPMISSWITGGTVKGVHPRKSCVSKGGTEITDFDANKVPVPMLKIEATRQQP